MAVPLTPDDLFELVRKSELINADRLRGYEGNLRVDSNPPTSARRLASRMIDDGWITRLQAGLLMQGKWKNFLITGKYKLLEHIGAGGMGQVFLCEHLRMARRVALKILPNDRAQNPTCLHRFYREARAAAVLNHPNIVTTHDIDSDGDLHFLVMEYVEGSNLLDIVKQSGPLTVSRAVEYTIQAACGLHHAHEAGLIHRDVKPSNLLLDRSGQVKLLDLGLARFFEDDVDQLTQQLGNHNLIGTADYLSPEQARDGHSADARSDIYSLGATLYFLLAGHAPFVSNSLAEKLMLHQNERPRMLHDFRPEVPEGLAAIVDCAMAKEPIARYQDCLQLIDVLAEFASESIPPPDVAEMPKLCPAVRSNDAPSVRVPAPERSTARMPRPALTPAHGTPQPMEFQESTLSFGVKHAIIAVAICVAGLIFGVTVGKLASDTNPVAADAGR